MVPDVIPHLIPRPAGQRIDLQDVFLPKSIKLIKLQNLYVRPPGRLLPTEPGDPGIELVQFLLQRLNLSQGAAEIGIAQPKFRSDVLRLLLHGALRDQRLNHNSKIIFEPGLQFERFGKEQSGIDREDRQRQTGRHRMMNRDQPGPLETGPDRRGLSKLLKGPLQDLSGRSGFKLCGQSGNFRRIEVSAAGI